ncbi:uncharacterized protein PHACADRAFT_256494 [Phanerochaete carnosa HHB-10118-sp]|uniref:CRIB domain-containing protein n=1 Tax=Phanerochaete carnosa (strain HHB-10118-sp) TaxID=650164 RepID=K5W907_PHACS|nr:uncharacterized protein PHACADRAFT_256494 [Phanerochaete carnosa HHB-10118-sp]EKM55690.1 hypothetical protein PHACADRAFT_256494 [Phanerochaete carnosa HHB-10118-sp]
MFNGHRNPTDKFYVLSTCFLVVATSISFLLVVIDTAKTTPNDFAGLGRPAAEAVIALSFMVVLLAMLALGITIYEKMHELPLVPSKHAEAGTDEAKHAPDGANRARAALSDMQAAAAGSSAGPDGHRRSVHFVVSDFKHVAHVGPDTLEQPQAIEPLDLETMEDVPLTPVDPSPRSEETVRLTVPEEAHTSATGKHRQMSYDLGYWSGIGRAV